MSNKLFSSKNLSTASHRDIFASRQSGKILTGELTSIEKIKKQSGDIIECGVIFYGEYKVYIPVSQMNISRPDIKVVRSMIGATVDFIVSEIVDSNKTAAASRKEAMEVRKRIELPKHKVGDIIYVRVTGIGLNDAIVEAFGIETKVGKNFIEWGHIQDISEILQIGDVKPALIKELDLEKDHILVSLKEATEDPYLQNVSSLKKNQECLATITGVSKFGIFFEIKGKKGVSALAPFPKWANFNPHIGDEILIRISKIDVRSREIDANLVRPVRIRKN